MYPVCYPPIGNGGLIDENRGIQDAKWSHGGGGHFVISNRPREHVATSIVEVNVSR